MPLPLLLLWMAAADLRPAITQALDQLGLAPQTGDARLNGTMFPVVTASGDVGFAELARKLREASGDDAIVSLESSVAGPVILVTPRPRPPRVGLAIEEAYSLSLLTVGEGQSVLLMTPLAPIVAMQQESPRNHPYSGGLLPRSRARLEGTLDLQYRFAKMQVRSFIGEAGLSLAEAKRSIDADLRAVGLTRMPQPGDAVVKAAAAEGEVLGSGPQLYMASDRAVTVTFQSVGRERTRVELHESQAANDASR